MADIPQLAEAVFSNDLIRDKILGYAIQVQERNSAIDRATLCFLRLVHPTWTKSITRVLQQRNQPLFQIVLDKSNSLNETKYVQQNGKLADKFVSAMTNRHDLVPTFRLTLTADYFQDENVKSLSRLWSRCADSLVELHVSFPMRETSFTCLLPRVSTPKLTKFTVTPCQVRWDMSSDHQENLESLTMTQLIHSVLSGADSISDFVVCNAPNSQYFTVPRSFKHLSIPSSITNLELACMLDEQIMKALLLENCYPNLAQISFVISRVPLQDGLLFQVLDKMKESLSSLTIRGVSYTATHQRLPTFLRLPVMKKLTKLFIESIHCELEPGQISLEQFFPKLEELHFDCQTVPMLQKWTEGSRFDGVKRLIVFSVNDAFPEVDEANFTQNLDVQTMQRLHLAFPNVTSLILVMTPWNISGLKYVFMEMKQLINLELRVVASPPDMNSDFWDSVLVGMPIEVVAALKANPDFWTHMQPQWKQLPGIYNLQALKTFALFEGSCLPQDTSGPPPPHHHQPLISDLTFSFAFREMPELKTVNLTKRFVVPRKTMEDWRNLGRHISYTP